MQISTSRHSLRPSKKFQQNSKKVMEAEGDFNRVALDPRVPDKISMYKQAKLLQFLDKKNDVFAWFTSDLVGVSKEVIEYKLQVNPHAMPKKQKLCKMSEEKIEAAKAEV
jgi:hypothetical protein